MHINLKNIDLYAIHITLFIVLQINLKNIDLKPIKSLINKLKRFKRIKDVDIIFKNHLNNKDVNPYCLLCSKKVISKQDILDLHKLYPVLDLIKEDLLDIYEYWELEYISRQNGISLDDLVINDINNLLLKYGNIISKHNSTVIQADKGQCKKEVQKFLNWRNYNTPNPEAISITPLDGTMFKTNGLEKGSSLNIYTEWKVSTFMLILEYNFLIKAWIYMNNKELSALPCEYKKCYDYWRSRQIIFYNIESSLFSKLKKGNIEFDSEYIPFLDSESLYREISEDLLYVLLNILLARSVLNNIDINKYINKDQLFNKKLEAILVKHYKKYKDEYSCLYKLREYICYNFMSLTRLKQFKD